MRRVAVVSWVVIAVASSLQAASIDVAPRAPERSHFIRAAGRQSDPVVATNGSDFFSAWADTRGGQSEIYGTAVRRDGHVANPLGLDLSFPDKQCFAPRLLRSGDRYLVAWISQNRLRIVPIDRNGKPLADPRTLIDGNVVDLSIASNARATMVLALVRGRDGMEFHFFALDRNLRVTATGRIATPWLSRLVVAEAGDGFAVVASNYELGLLMWRVDDRRGFLNETPITLDPNVAPNIVRVASNGGKLLVAYTAQQQNWSIVVMGCFVSGDAASAPFEVARREETDLALGTEEDGFLLALTTPTGREYPPYGGDVGPFDRASFDIDTMHIAPNGHLSSSTRIVSGHLSDEQPAFVLSGGSLFVAWIEHAIADDWYKIAATIVGSDDAIDIARSAPRQAFPAVASTGDDFLYVWQEEPANDGKSMIFASRQNGARFALPTTGTNHTYPSVASDRTRYLVTWIERRTSEVLLVGRFVNRDGAPDGAPFDISEGELDQGMRPAVASNGNGFVVLYGTGHPLRPHVLRAANIDAKGKVTRMQLLIDGGSYIPGDLKLTAKRDSYVAAWVDGNDANVVEFLPSVSYGFVLSRTHPLLSRYEVPAVACTTSTCAIAGTRLYGGLFVALFPQQVELASLPLVYFKEVQLVTANGFVALGKDGDDAAILSWRIDTNEVRAHIENRMIGEYSVASNAAGDLGIAYVAPIPDVGGVQRVHWAVVEH